MTYSWPHLLMPIACWPGHPMGSTIWTENFIAQVREILGRGATW